MSPLFRTLFRVNMLFLALSGVGHMPIFKRYYIADIPGFGWLAQFHVTLAVHSITAALFLAMAAWISTTWYLTAPRSTFTPSARVKIAFYVALIASGGILVFKNLKGVYLPGPAITATDLVHLFAAFALGITALTARATRQRWTQSTACSPAPKGVIKQ